MQPKLMIGLSKTFSNLPQFSVDSAFTLTKRCARPRAGVLPAFSGAFESSVRGLRAVSLAAAELFLVRPLTATLP
jgi:hypothetical protein